MSDPTADTDRAPYLTQRLHRREQLALAAVESAVGCARMFVSSTLARWQLNALQDDAVLVVSELVTNSVKATGVTGDRPDWGGLARLNLIHIHLLALETCTVVAVRDVSNEAPRLAEPDAEAENGRGLFLVQELTSQWGSHRTPQGKVVWAQFSHRSGVLPRRRRSRALNVEPVALADADLLERVLTGLERL